MLKMMFDQEKCTTFLFFDVVFSAVEMFIVFFLLMNNLTLLNGYRD